MAKLINGDGNPAIYAAEDSDWFASIMGNQTSITGVGSQFAATITDANTVTVADGVIITKEGRRIQLDVNMDDSFTIPAGQQDVTNYYIIGYHLVSDDLSVQTAEKFVQLMDSASATIPEDTFRGGADDVYVSLYRVTQVGLSLTSLQALLPKITNVHGTEAMLATVQNSNKASRTFNKGEYIQLNNTYYKITDTVASGATFTEGVNISATNIGDELTQINSDLSWGNYTTSGYLKYRKNALFVELLVFASSITVPNSGVSLGTLPVGYRPKVDILGTLSGIGQDSAAYPVRIWIDLNGNVQCTSWAAVSLASAGFYCVFPYN